MNGHAIGFETLDIAINGGNAPAVQVYEAAIKYFISKIPLGERPRIGDEINVSNWLRRRVELRPQKQAGSFPGTV